MLLGLPEHVFLNNKVLPLLPPLPQYTAEGPDKGREVVGEGKLLEGGGKIGEETQCQQQPAEEEVKDTAYYLQERFTTPVTASNNDSCIGSSDIKL